MAFSDFAQLRYTSLVHIITIEGIGSSAGLDKFCSKVPQYAAGDARYKPWFPIGSELENLPQDVEPLGGVAELGVLPFELMDGEGPDDTYPLYNYLTKAFGTDTQEDGALQSAISASDASLTVVAPASIIASIGVDSVLYMGSEALLVTAVTGSTSTTKTVDVTRAFLDTDAEAHDADDAVYLHTPYVEGRLVRLYFAYDEPGFVEGDETEIGPGWTIDNYDPSQDIQAYSFTTYSGRGLFDRQVNQEQFRAVLTRAEGTGGDRQLFLERAEGALPDTDADHFGDPVFLKVGDEILAADWPTSTRPSWLVRRTHRRLFATQQEELEPGLEVRQVLAVHDDWGSFRFQEPGGETSARTTGTWNTTGHPIPVALCLFTSSARSANGDDLELSNWTAGSGNFSALPAGLGAGIPIGKINWQSFHEIWVRHPEWKLENLVLEDTTDLRGWLDENICRPFGIAFTVKAGQIVAYEDVTAPIPSTGIQWGPADILLERTAKGRARPVLHQRRAKNLRAPSVTFIAKNAQGVESRVTFNDADFGDILGNTRRHYRRETRGIEIPVPGARFDGRGSDDQFEGRAFDLLLLFRRTPWIIELSTDLSKANDADIFDVILLSHPRLINDRTRSRGWTDEPCRVLSMVIDRVAQKIDWVLLSGLGAAKPGLIGPAAVINDISGSPTIGVESNRFTDANVPAGLSLPSSDTEAFGQGDVVRIKDEDGTWASPDTETIVDTTPGTDQIELSGDFSGALATGQRLVSAMYDDVVEDQLEDVFYADGTSGVLGDAGDAAYTYGQS